MIIIINHSSRCGNYNLGDIFAKRIYTVCHSGKYFRNHHIKKQPLGQKSMEQLTVFSEKTDVLPQLRIFSFSTAVTLKNRSRSAKSNKFFVVSQLYIPENLVRIGQLVQDTLQTKKCYRKKDKKVLQNFQFF